MFPEEKKVGLIFAVIILLPTLVPLISGIVIKPEKEVSVDIPLCQVSNTATIEVAKNEQEMYLNVPDYNASIFINMSKQKYIVGDIASINVKIQDSGIIKLSKPYFYLLVFNPSDKLKGIFPCFINEKEKQFSSNQGSSYNLFHNKWDKWVSPVIYANYQSISCPDESFYISQNPPNCIYRNSFINGNIGTNPILYNFKIAEPGTWKIYVFLFDEDYKSRANEKLLQNGNEIESFHNAVASGGYVFTANSEAGLTESSGIDITKYPNEIFSIIFAGFGYYLMGRKEIYPRLKELYYKHIKKLKFEIIGLLVFLIIITIYDLLVFKWLI
ncbi:MAG: hypothetical protein O8C62_11385 [Candidatus Methanoperedens sp.]|nr:hypothetical protein [Candidatus Methanoperedens sp.]